MKKLNLLIAIFLFISIVAHAQTVSTIYGGSCTDGLAQDLLGNIYCSDWGGNIVYRIDSTGNSSIYKGGFVNPNGIAVDDTNHIYICDHTDNRIEKYDQAGNLIRNYNGFNSPSGIKKLPNSDNFIIVEYNFGRIKILQPDGIVTLKNAGAPLNGPAGIAIIDTNIYIANFNDRKIYSYINDTLNFIAQLPSHPGSFNFLGFLTALNGNLYATHISGHRIYKIDPNSGIMSVFAGSISGAQDGSIGVATFNQPNGILADTLNNRLYISEAGSQNLRVINNLSVGISKLNMVDFQFTIYPNPSHNELNIKLKGTPNRSVNYTIFNQMGQVLLSKESTPFDDTLKINLEESLFPTGHYVINLDIDGKTQSRSFIVE